MYVRGMTVREIQGFLPPRKSIRSTFRVNLNSVLNTDGSSSLTKNA